MNPGSLTGPIADIVNSIGQYLAPQQAFTSTLPYETYAAPQQEAFNIWQKQTYRPEFEKYTLNPFRNESANTYALNDSNMMGNAPGLWDRQQRAVETPYYNDLEAARKQWEDMIYRGYQQQLQNYYNSPTAFNNIGQSATRSSQPLPEGMMKSTPREVFREYAQQPRGWTTPKDMYKSLFNYYG
jgi:hypothetical protein